MEDVDGHGFYGVRKHSSSIKIAALYIFPPYKDFSRIIMIVQAGSILNEYLE
jgi:hypothetical protein